MEHGIRRIPMIKETLPGMDEDPELASAIHDLKLASEDAASAVWNVHKGGDVSNAEAVRIFRRVSDANQKVDEVLKQRAEKRRTQEEEADAATQE